MLIESLSSQTYHRLVCCPETADFSNIRQLSARPDFGGSNSKSSAASGPIALDTDSCHFRLQNLMQTPPSFGDLPIFYNGSRVAPSFTPSRWLTMSETSRCGTSVKTFPTARRCLILRYVTVYCFSEFKDELTERSKSHIALFV